MYPHGTASSERSRDHVSTLPLMMPFEELDSNHQARLNASLRAYCCIDWLFATMRVYCAHLEATLVTEFRVASVPDPSLSASFLSNSCFKPRLATIPVRRRLCLL